jgi:hypothetical protein
MSFLRARFNASNMAALVCFEEIRKGGVDAVTPGMDAHEDEIIEAIANKVTSINVCDLESLK